MPTRLLFSEQLKAEEIIDELPCMKFNIDKERWEFLTVFLFGVVIENNFLRVDEGDGM